MTTAHVLVVDDELSIRNSLGGILSDEGYRVSLAEDGQSALAAMAASGDEPPDVVLLDIWMPGMDGIQVLRQLKARPNPPEVVMISGHGNIEVAVEAVKLGAFDFMEKPLSLERILLTVRRALDHQRLLSENLRLRTQLGREHELVGCSPEMERLRQIIATAGPSNARVLIFGENGTGKELVARAMHRASSRAGGPFVEVNCAALPEELIESELFGHERGAFTGATRSKRGKFELADEGTLFLDEVGDMSLKVQAKVLRALEDGRIQRIGGERSLPVDVRVIAATNKDLEAMIRRGQFREDLFYRLNVIPVRTSPLRERRMDVPVLVEHYLRQCCEQNGRPLKTVSAEAMEILVRYDWPGNVRELRNVVERLVIMVPQTVIAPSHLPVEMVGGTFPTSERGRALGVRKTLWEARRDFEREFIAARLAANLGNVTRTAQELGIERSNLHRKLRALGITGAREEEAAGELGQGGDCERK